MLTDQVGDSVFIRGAMNGFYKVARTDPKYLTKMPAIGIIIRKWDYTSALVQLYGEIKGLYTGLSPGKRYFVGLDGRPALPEDFEEMDPGERWRIQTLGVSLDVGVLLLEPSNDLITRVG
jgi:hypothetical protein